MKRIILFLLTLFCVSVVGYAQQHFDYHAGIRTISFYYAHTANTQNTGNNYKSRSANDVIYYLSLRAPMDIEISHCGSLLSDTYVTLLNSLGAVLGSNDDYSGVGACSNTRHSYLKMTNLQAGDYYIVSEGYSSNGSITTTIKGNPVNNEGGTGGVAGIGSAGENYILTITPTVGKSDISGLTADSCQRTLQYFDGLGRAFQTVQVGIGQNKRDLVTYQEYDNSGRETNAWLPVIAPTGNNGNTISLNTLKTLSSLTYGDTKAYAKPVYEASPLSRLLEEFGPGQQWHENGKRMKTEYLANTSEYTCRKYSLLTSLDETQVAFTTENYPAYELYVTRRTDEDSLQINLEFKDKQGRVLLHRQMNGNASYDTYYVYDIYGNLRAVLPPLAASATSSQWQEAISRYAYLYKYDVGRRMIGKKLPGADWIINEYDAACRLIYTKDGVQQRRNPREWTFFLYDNLNRMVLQGICTNGAYTGILSSKMITSYNGPNTGIGNSGYSQNMYIESPVLHQVNYYDNYIFRDQAGFSNNSNFPAPPSLDSGKGKLTGNISTLSDGTTKIYTAYYYDEKGNLANTVASNHLGGYDKTSVTYTFTGQPKTIQFLHTASGKTTQTQLYTYTYDHAGRLKTVSYKLNANTAITLVQNEYDNLGRLIDKKLHGSTSTNNWQSYSYNVRGWTTAITGGIFNQNLYYNTGNGSHRWNGNVSSMIWKAGSETTDRGYKFTYDGLNRLTNATYGETSAISGTNKYGEILTYDMHGNIKTLKRYGNTSRNSYGLTDNLSFGYNGNQLKYVNDAVTATISESFHFRDGSNSTGDEYAFDGNGNMIKDLNKNISLIEYNSLNLPVKVTWGDGNTTSYLYNPDGVKYRTVHRTGSVTKTTDCCGSVVYENGVVKRILTEEGYLTLSGTTPAYYYYLKDHLGNNRVVINSGGTVQQTNHFYPFGGTFASTSESLQPYKYNGKELDKENGLELYDYGARNYDAGIGRFTQVDPLAEKYYGISPYGYCANNPVMYVDPDGRKIVIGTFWQRVGHKLGFDNYVSQVKNQIKMNSMDSRRIESTYNALEESELTFRILPLSESPVKDAEKKGNHVIPDSKPERGKKQGATMYFDPDNEYMPNGEKRDPRIGLAHETGHLEDFMNGNFIPTDLNKFKAGDKVEIYKRELNEQNSLELENIIRAILNYRIREEYFENQSR